MVLATLVVLSEPVLAARLDELIALDRTIEGESWKAEEFRLELPDKFRRSRLAVDPEGSPVGFVVASRKGDWVHVHRLVVGPGHQRSGIGRRLLGAVATGALQDGLKTLTLKVSRSNEEARRFYERLGFEAIEEGVAQVQLAAATVSLANGLEASSRTA